jgi:hypothetical protein
LLKITLLFFLFGYFNKLLYSSSGSSEISYGQMRDRALALLPHTLEPEAEMSARASEGKKWWEKIVGSKRKCCCMCVRVLAEDRAFVDLERRNLKEKNKIKKVSKVFLQFAIKTVQVADSDSSVSGKLWCFIITHTRTNFCAKSPKNSLEKFHLK